MGKIDDWLEGYGIMWKNGSGFLDTRQPESFDENLAFRVKQKLVESGEANKTCAYLFERDGCLRIVDPHKFEAKMQTHSRIEQLPVEVVKYLMDIKYSKNEKKLSVEPKSYLIIKHLHKKGDEHVEMLVPGYQMEKVFQPEIQREMMYKKMMNALWEMIQKMVIGLTKIMPELQRIIEEEIVHLEKDHLFEIP